MHLATSCSAFCGAGLLRHNRKRQGNMIPRHEKHDSARNTATQLPSMEVIGKTNALSPAYAGGQVSSGLQFYGAAIGSQSNPSQGLVRSRLPARTPSHTVH